MTEDLPRGEVSAEPESRVRSWYPAQRLHVLDRCGVEHPLSPKRLWFRWCASNDLFGDMAGGGIDASKVAEVVVLFGRRPEGIFGFRGVDLYRLGPPFEYLRVENTPNHAARAVDSFRVRALNDLHADMTYGTDQEGSWLHAVYRICEEAFLERVDAILWLRWRGLLPDPRKIARRIGELQKEIDRGSRLSEFGRSIADACTQWTENRPADWAYDLWDEVGARLRKRKLIVSRSGSEEAVELSNWRGNRQCYARVYGQLVRLYMFQRDIEKDAGIVQDELRPANLRPTATQIHGHVDRITKLYLNHPNLDRDLRAATEDGTLPTPGSVSLDDLNMDGERIRKMLSKAALKKHLLPDRPRSDEDLTFRLAWNALGYSRDEAARLLGERDRRLR